MFFHQDQISDQLARLSEGVARIPQGIQLVGQWRDIIDSAALAFSYWKQRLKNLHTQFGESASAFFFKRFRNRSHKNCIFMLRGADGSWVDSAQDVEAQILSYFKAVFEATPPTSDSPLTQGENIDIVLCELNLPQLSESEASRLVAPISGAEIQAAMFSIRDDKSPGLDGFPAIFFKIFWDSFGPLVISAVSMFFETSFMLKEWNQTLVVLIPKTDSPLEVPHFRPISLCNVIYKCVSKCLVRRLQPLLSQLIDNYQNAFVPGRHMSDNILLSHELLHTLNKQRSGAKQLAALKIDMNKAYDRVNWLFLLKVMRAYGFPAPWVNLIHQCISTVSYRILINGAASHPFQPSCGLRQGDPLSPYLFLFCMDILSCMTSLAVDIKKFAGINAPGIVLSSLTCSLPMMLCFSFEPPKKLV